MRPIRSASLLAIVVAVVFTACTSAEEASTPPTASIGSGSPGSGTTPSAQPVTDYLSFTDGLEAAGFDVQQGRTMSDSLFGSGRTLSIDGVEVRTFEYPNAKALDEFRASVSRDGYSVPTKTGGIVIVEWVQPPHFYGSGRLLVLYLGDRPKTLAALDRLLGRPFAGG